jgi:hypothetical protein
VERLFHLLGICLDDPSKEPWVNEQQASLEELHQQLLREGWRLVGRDFEQAGTQPRSS